MIFSLSHLIFHHTNIFHKYILGIDLFESDSSSDEGDTNTKKTKKGNRYLIDNV
jgi:hypothetical protein